MRSLNVVVLRLRQLLTRVSWVMLRVQHHLGMSSPCWPLWKRSSKKWKNSGKTYLSKWIKNFRYMHLKSIIVPVWHPETMTKVVWAQNRGRVRVMHLSRHRSSTISYSCTQSARVVIISRRFLFTSWRKRVSKSSRHPLKIIIPIFNVSYVEIFISKNFFFIFFLFFESE